jgi:voltage-gated potassium channel
VALASAFVYLGHHGWDAAIRQAAAGSPSVHYATVTLPAIGYGDIVPVTTAVRLVNTVVITPMRVMFLIILVGTSLQVLTERTRTNWRTALWRSK